MDKILFDLLPFTEKEVKKGNKIFGGLILSKNNYSVISIGTNKETINPLLHGEISTINNFFNLDSTIDPKKCLFVSSHEPCSLCLSAITWSGFDNFIYLFPYEETKSTFNIPHDLKILDEVFNIKNGKYNQNNNYWKSFSIFKEILKLPMNSQLLLNKKINKIQAIYNKLSVFYQKNKFNNKIPLN